jgi:diguanylate cyclase (GGDEF)-like protein/PAS domain S-box-containing protein
MQPAPLPTQPAYEKPGIPVLESERLATLRRLRLLDTPPTEEFDRITRLAAQLLDVPITLVSLVDEHRQWFKSRVGLHVSQTPREVSFCAHVVYDREPLCLADASKDPRFAGNPLVTGPPHVRAYLGIPIFTQEGHTIGTLCAIDTRRRNFDERDAKTLSDLAKILEDGIHAHERETAAAVAMKFSEEHLSVFRDTFEMSSVGIVHTSLSGHIIRINPRAADMLGYRKEELHSRSFVDLIHPGDIASSLEHYRQCAAGQLDLWTLDQRCLRKDGSTLWVELSASLKRADTGGPDYLVTVLHDIESRKQSETALRAAKDELSAAVVHQRQEIERTHVELRINANKALDAERSTREIEHRLQEVTDHIPANIAYWNRDLCCEFANDAYCAMFAMSPQRINGMRMEDVLGEQPFAAAKPHIRFALAGEEQRFETSLTGPDGGTAFYEVRYIPDASDPARIKGFFVLLTDITELQHARMALEASNEKQLSERVADQLTGLSNRRVFEERIEEAYRRCKRNEEPYGLIMLDLDSVKDINDAYGHEAGDEVLRRAAGAIKSQLRSHRDVGARIGGEQFAMLCFGNLDPELLDFIANGVRQSFGEEPVETAHGPVRVSAIIGRALSRIDDEDWKPLYARAASDLYRERCAAKMRSGGAAKTAMMRVD